MYKLFLTLRYLTRKKIVIFPILVVWLCVMMLIIVTSIMGGFVDRVRDANRELFGDIIISSASSSQGFPGYDDLSNALRAKFPDQILATTPVVEAYSLLYVPGAMGGGRSVPALLVGVRPEERSQVSKFRESLFLQYQAPMQAVDVLSKSLPATREELIARASKNLEKASSQDYAAATELMKVASQPDAPAPAFQRLVFLVLVAAAGLGLFMRARRKRTAGPYLTAGIVSLAGATLVVAAVWWPVWFPRQYDLAEDRAHQTQMNVDEARRTHAYAESLPAGKYQSREELIKALIPGGPSFTPPAAAQSQIPGMQPLPPEGCIVGSQIGFFSRDSRGNFVHHYPDIFPEVSITVFPPLRQGRINTTLSTLPTYKFTIIDDSHSGVYDIDSLNVYAPFDTVQLMAGMRPDPEIVKEDPTANFAPRCHQLLIKLKPDALKPGQDLKFMRRQVGDYVHTYLEEHRLALPLSVQTWDEKQARYLGAVENEKTMMTFIMLLMSLVVLVVIFLIFYQIVRDKTRDIGIIKAVGGSEEGVASIFLTYGFMIGVVGGGLGVLTGCLFVTHTNQIHEWIFQATGIVIWDRSVYLFDRIPDVVAPWDVMTYYVVALLAGVVGALIPAFLAALEDPVQAVRYE